MKIQQITLAIVSVFILAITSCGNKENTGNGANDPTSEYESDRVKHLDGNGKSSNDTMRSTEPTSNDTTTEDKIK